MKCIINNLQLLLSVLGGYIGWFIGGVDSFLFALIAFVIIDYLTGIMGAILEKKLSSEVGYRGIFKKILVFVLVGVGHTVDLYLVQRGSVFRTAVIFFYLSNEGISILENVSKIGLPIPKRLKQALERFADDSADDSAVNKTDNNKEED